LLRRIFDHLGDAVLGLGDGHAVAGDDDDAASPRAGPRRRLLGGGLDLHSPTGCLAAAGRRRAAVAAEAAGMTLMNERFIALHMMYERIAPLLPTSAPVMMRRSLLSMKPAALGGPARVAVEHRDDDGHVGAADGHDQVHADDAGDAGHDEQRQQARVRGRGRREELVAEEHAAEQHRQI
jgi:hypothetical protein